MSDLHNLAGKESGFSGREASVSLDPWNDYPCSPGWRVLQVRTVKYVVCNLTWWLAQGPPLYPGWPDLACLRGLLAFEALQHPVPGSEVPGISPSLWESRPRGPFLHRPTTWAACEHSGVQTRASLYLTTPLQKTYADWCLPYLYAFLRLFHAFKDTHLYHPSLHTYPFMSSSKEEEKEGREKGKNLDLNLCVWFL